MMIEKKVLIQSMASDKSVLKNLDFLIQKKNERLKEISNKNQELKEVN